MINDFRGKYRWLSNYHPSLVILDGMTYPTVEHAYQAAKCSDPEYRQRMVTIGQPSAARRLGQQCPLRADWEAVKVDVMFDLIRQKFAVGTPLANQLLATKDIGLIEGNTWGDQFWGVCNGVGQNWLGRLLMHQRSVIRGEIDDQSINDQSVKDGCRTL